VSPQRGAAAHRDHFSGTLFERSGAKQRVVSCAGAATQSKSQRSRYAKRADRPRCGAAPHPAFRDADFKEGAFSKSFQPDRRCTAKPTIECCDFRIPRAFATNSFPDNSARRRGGRAGSALLDPLTTLRSVVIISNMKAVELVRTRIIYSETAFAELVLWQLPASLPGSSHQFKYRLAYVVRGECVLRYDNEAGKGDHRHYGSKESGCVFTDPDELIAAFQADIARWNRENSDS
jgi:hypothetical protein